MSWTEKTLKDALDTLINRFISKEKFYSKLGKATEINETELTFVFVPNDETAPITCNMAVVETATQAFVLVPKDGSTTVVTFTNKGDPYQVNTQEAEKVLINAEQTVFNAGSNGGLIVVGSQTAKLNQLVSEMQTELAAIAIGIAGAGGTYTPGTLTTFNKSDYENDKVKQGRSYPFSFTISGDDANDFTVIVNVVQKPGGTAALTQTLEYSNDTRSWSGAFSGTDTAQLNVGEWWMVFTAENTDENVGEPVKLYVQRGWQAGL